MPSLTLSGYIQFDYEDLATFTQLTHLTQIQSVFLQSSAMPIVKLITALTNLESLNLMSNHVVVDPNPFFCLTKLRNLACQISSSPLKTNEIAKMTNLKRNCISSSRTKANFRAVCVSWICVICTSKTCLVCLLRSQSSLD